MNALYDIPREFIIGLADAGTIHYTFSFAFVVNGFLCALVIGPLLGVIGTMVVAKRMAFFSQAVGNAALTGVAIGVIIGESYTAPYVSMFSFCLLFALSLNFTKNHTKMSWDTLIAAAPRGEIAISLPARPRSRVPGVPATPAAAHGSTPSPRPGSPGPDVKRATAGSSEARRPAVAARRR